MTLDSAYFDDIYSRSDDPWGFADRWYEQRKYALTLAALPQPRYRRALEVGCSIGILTAALARRCEALLAVDVAAAAVAAAATRTAEHPQVLVEQRQLPRQWPEGTFDLAILSEVGYYFDDADLRQLADRAVEGLEPGGTLVAVHWRHPVADYPQSGDAVHAALDRTPNLCATVRHTETDFLLGVYARTPPAARSVAEQTGLV